MKTSIIATGASLKGFDFDKIKGHKIAINYAYKYVDYDFYVAMDNPHRHNFDGERLHTHEMWVKKYNLNATGYRKTGFKGIEREQGCVGAINGTLFSAINIALNMGFKEIDIYGADMRLINGFVHFYSEEPCTPNLVNQYKRIFMRHQSHKKLIESQLLPDEKLNWIGWQGAEEDFNGVVWELT